MPNDFVNKTELAKERVPSDLWDWLIRKVGQICSTKDGEKAFRLQKGLIKKLVEEVAPLAIYGKHKYPCNNQILLKPVIGNQNYDAIVRDVSINPPSQSYIEITQAHEGQDDYFRRCELLKKGCVPRYSPVIKSGKKNRVVSIPFRAISVEERVNNELERIRTAAEKKAGRDYGSNTYLLIFFDDAPPFQEAIDNAKLDSFMNDKILNLDLRFSQLYLVGETESVFREYLITK